MTTLMPWNEQQYFDVNGDPVASGKLYSYEAGTSTPKPIYADTEGEIAHTNPAILDDDGSLVAYLGEGAYKLILTDAHDVQLWTLDQVSGGPFPTGVSMELPVYSVPLSAGQAEVLVTDAYPAGQLVMGVDIEVTAPLGQTQGLQTFAVGDEQMVGRWGTGLTPAAGVKPRVQGGPVMFPQATPLRIVAEGGLFDGQGTVQVKPLILRF